MSHLVPPIAVFATFALALASQQPTPPVKGPAGDAQDKAKIDKLAEWPAPKAGERERVQALVDQFKKPEVELHDPAAQKLVELGETAAPLVMSHVTDRPDADAFNNRLFSVLDRTLSHKHAALMAREAKKPKVELRRYLTLRMCRLCDADLTTQLNATRKDKDERTAFYASLGALALKQKEALPEVLAYTRAHWSEVQALVAEVLPAARSAEAAQQVFEHIAKANAATQMNGLRLLRYLMVKEQGVVLRTYLSASDNAVLREAVNTARALHGEAPIENLPVFQVIEMAKQWLQKV